MWNEMENNRDKCYQRSGRYERKISIIYIIYAYRKITEQRYVLGKFSENKDSYISFGLKVNMLYQEKFIHMEQDICLSNN